MPSHDRQGPSYARTDGSTDWTAENEAQPCPGQCTTSRGFSKPHQSAALQSSRVESAAATDGSARDRPNAGDLRSRVRTERAPPGRARRRNHGIRRDDWDR